jgi:EmrB/QacA subfamily drug resistance transporter
MSHAQQLAGRLASPAPRGLVLTLSCAGMAMVGLDTAIVNVAVPSIQRDLGVSAGTSQWVVVAYGLVLGGFLLLGGRLTDHLGRRRVFMAGVTVFAGASLVAGLAQSAGVLVAARAVQGFGAALIAPAAISLIAVTFPEGRERDRALGIFGAVGGLGGSLGVVLSGLLTAGPGWRWAFLINVPAGALFVAVAALALTPDRPADRTSRLDVTGATTVTGGLLLLVYAMHHAATHGLTSASTLLLFGTAVGLLVLFARVESRSAHPLVPASTLRNRPLVTANITAFLAYAALLAFIFNGSLLMQQALGWSPTRTGVAWLTTTLTVFVAAMVGARLAARVPVRLLLVTGLATVAAGALWLTRVPVGASYAVDLLPSFLLVGVGFGLCGPALQIGALTGVSRSEAGLASGLVETMREVGGAAGVAAVSTVLVGGAGLDGFHTAFAVIGGLAGTGLLVAAAGFTQRRPRQAACPSVVEERVAA